jgi:hypothetical protein
MGAATAVDQPPDRLDEKASVEAQSLSYFLNWIRKKGDMNVF